MSKHRHDRRQALLARAIAEQLEQRRLLSGEPPMVVAPPASDATTHAPDGHFNFSTGPQELLFAFDQPVTVGQNAISLRNLSTGEIIDDLSDITAVGVDDSRTWRIDSTGDGSV